MKNTLSLNGTWQMAGFEPGEGNWSMPGSLLRPGVEVMAALVPGEVQRDLLRANRIQDPAFGLNARDVDWVLEKEWWYKRDFDVEEDFLRKRTFLEFGALGGCATVFLNGKQVGDTKNGLIPHKFDVTDTVIEGRNTLAVRIVPPDTSSCIEAYRGIQDQLLNRLAGLGMWRDVKLTSYEALSIADVRVDTEIEGAFANAWITIEVNNYTAEDQHVMATVVVSSGEAREKIEVVDMVTPFGGVIEAVVRIEEPQLWWPNGMGEPSLYNCQVGLTWENEVQDVAERKFGVRNVRLIQADESGNPTFMLLVNDRRIFCKGATWKPADFFLSKPTSEDYRKMVGLAQQANLNMLRVTGDGIYECQEFYDACDEMGIMVWQDFMFSDVNQPQSDEFAKLVMGEVRTIVKELRNHPSLVMWCGSSTGKGKSNINPVLEEQIPKLLMGIDTTRPYLPYPTGADTHIGPQSAGDLINKLLSAPESWREIVQSNTPPFINTFTAESVPGVASLREFIPEENLFPPSNEIWEAHSIDITSLLELTRKLIGDFDDIDDFSENSQILQGEVIKAAIEHYRREKWQISGAIIDSLNESWPTICGSMIDYCKRPKMAYYYAKRACEPVIVSFKVIDDRLQLHVTSDERATEFLGEAHIGVYTFGTFELETEKVQVALDVNSTGVFWESAPLDKLFVDPVKQCLLVVLRAQRNVVGKNIFFPLPFAQMDFPSPKLLVQREQSKEQVHEMIVGADSFARNVSIENLPSEAIISDNYFDIIPGEQHHISITGITEEQAQKLSLRVWRKS